MVLRYKGKVRQGRRHYVAPLEAEFEGVVRLISLTSVIPGLISG